MVLLLEQANASPEVGLKVLEIIDIVGIPMQQTPAIVMKIAQKYVNLFFQMISWKGNLAFELFTFASLGREVKSHSNL